MRKLIAVSFCALAFAACSSSGNATAKLAKPEILLVQTSSVPQVARNVQGGVSVHYALRVSNRSGETITLKRVSLQSISEAAAYVIQPTSRPFDLAIAPEQFQEVEMWAAAQTGPSLVGANGPVTLRVTAEFDSPVGKFQEIVVRTVNGRASINGQQ